MSSTELTASKKEVFFKVYRKTHNVTEACGIAEINRISVYDWRKSDPKFAREWQEIQEQYIEKLEREADRRGVDGIDHPVIHQGVITTTYKEYSDNLLMFRLKRLDPQYRDRLQITVDKDDTDSRQTLDAAMLDARTIALVEELAERVMAAKAVDVTPTQHRVSSESQIDLSPSLPTVKPPGSDDPPG